MQLNRIELADIHDPSDLARALIGQMDTISGAVPLEEIAFALGIEEIRREALDGFEGVLLTDKCRTRGRILVNTRRGAKAVRFGIAHELGHFLLERHALDLESMFACTVGDMRQARTASVSISPSRCGGAVSRPGSSRAPSTARPMPS